MNEFPLDGTTEAEVTETGLVLHVPNKQVARLIQLGIHADRETRRRSQRRKAQRLARRINRK